MKDKQVEQLEILCIHWPLWKTPGDGSQSTSRKEIRLKENEVVLLFVSLADLLFELNIFPRKEYKKEAINNKISSQVRPRFNNSIWLLGSFD